MPDASQDLAPLEFLQLIAEQHRWRLLVELSRSDRRVGELTELLGEQQNLVSYHLAQLREAGLISSRRSSADGRDTYYRIEPDRCGELMEATAEVLRPELRLVPQSPESAGRAGKPTRVLFLCTGNSSRSQMAEAFLERDFGGRFEARSAGSHPKPLHPNTVRVLAERGIDSSHRRSKSLSRFARTRFDVVVTLCDKVREVCPEFIGAPAAAHWSVPDPAAGGGDTFAAFRRAADDIEERVRRLIARIDQERRAA